MCEKCEARNARNTEIKRAAMALLFADPPTAELYDQALQVPGYLPFLSLCRQMEQLTRLRPPSGDGVDPELAEAMRAELRALTAEQRSDALRVATSVLDMAHGIRLVIGQAKIDQKDSDTPTVAIVMKDGALVVLVNGEEVNRIEISEGAGEEEIEDAAERAMRAHREQHPEGF